MTKSIITALCVWCLCVASGCQEKKSYASVFTPEAPVIDAEIDPAWRRAKVAMLKNFRFKEVFWQNEKDLAASCRVLWDSVAVYVLVEVTDDVKFTQRVLPDSADRYMWGSHDYDAVDVIFRKSQRENYSYRWNYQSDSLIANAAAPQARFHYKDTPQGYVFEARFPLAALGGPAGGPLGFEVLVADNDLTPQPGLYGGRETTLGWAGQGMLVPQGPVSASADPADAPGRLVFLAANPR